MYPDEKFKLYSSHTLKLLLIALVVFIIMIVMAICMPVSGDLQWFPVVFIAIAILLLLLIHLFKNVDTHPDNLLYPFLTNCKITDSRLEINNQIYPFNRFHLHPEGCTYHVHKNNNRSTWYIEVITKDCNKNTYFSDSGLYSRPKNKYFSDNQSGKIELPFSGTKHIGFQCSHEKYRELADSLMRLTQKEAPEALQFDFTDNEDKYQPEAFWWKIIDSFLITIILVLFALSLFAILCLIPGLESVFSFDNLLPAIIWLSAMTFITSLIYYLLKKKKTIPVNTISINNNKLIINGEDFDWQEIKEASLSCGRMNRNQERILSITTEHATRYYSYTLYFSSDGLQKIIEKWFYYKLKYRFTPVFVGQN